MIPTRKQAVALWDTYALPDIKRTHCTLVARLAVWFAQRLTDREHIAINIPLLEAAALLHDIDKAIPRLSGEHHPDTAVRVLREEGMEEVAVLVMHHPLHAILHPDIAPKTIEEQLLYLSDKMVKYEIITVDARFALWKAEHLPQDAVSALDAAYPKAKKLEQEILARVGVSAGDVAVLATGRG